MDLPQRVRHASTGVVLVLIPPGRFTMGTPADEKERDGDEFQREIEVEAAFYLAETEVTLGLWEEVMGADPEHPHANRELPAGGISWHRAQEFLVRMNKSHGPGWRLPTEIQWEYACRAGTTTPFSFGVELTPHQANYNGQSPYAHGERGLRRDQPIPVRSLPANPWGLYEMHGNLWEWCEDPYVFEPVTGQPLTQSEGGSRVIRGGAFTSQGKRVRSGHRDGYPPSSAGEKYGFRIAKAIRPF
jgi:sulfatase modifying factor 1